MIEEQQVRSGIPVQPGEFSLLKEFDRMRRMTEGRYPVADLVTDKWWQERNARIGYETTATKNARRLIDSVLGSES